MSEQGAAKGVAGSRLGNTPLPHENEPGTSPVSPTSGEWKSHILGGCTLQDYSSCCWTLWCPHATFGTIANALDNTPGSMDKSQEYAWRQMWCGSAWFSHPYRTKLRAKYQLPEKPCSDFHAHCLLSPCALCQEYRELELRGVDMGIEKESVRKVEKYKRFLQLYAFSIGINKDIRQSEGA
ncbi:unnamed protein product [Sphagnum balticum]